MKSTIKIDVNYQGKPVIEIQYFSNTGDLRDKMLGMFLETLKPNGRLCFIDSWGSKGAESEGINMTDYTITPIKPCHYELIIEELQTLITERDSMFPMSESILKNQEEEIKRIRNTFGEKESILNY